MMTGMKGLGTARFSVFLAILLLCSGCALFTETVYLHSPRRPIPLVPRPKISVNPTTVEQLRKDRSVLKRAVRAWEKMVVRRNKEILEYNNKNNFPADPDSVVIKTEEYE